MAADPILVQIHQDEVLTGEAVALDVQPVGYFLRALGVLIDMLVSLALLLLFALVASWLVGAGVVDDTVVPILTIVMAVLVLVVLPTVVEATTRGRSLGRLAVGGRIVRADGGASGFRQAFIRALTGVLELWFTFGALAAIVGAFTPRSQRLGDLLAGTYSERTRTPKLGGAPLPVPPPLAAWAEIADVARLPDPLARRIVRFAVSAPNLEPGVRARLAASLVEESRAFVSPLPAMDAETVLRGITAVRRDREERALQLRAERVDALARHAGDPPRGFPAR